MDENIQHILDGDDRRRVVVNGNTIGWITKWYERDAVNATGIKRYSAQPIGTNDRRTNCETYQSAVTFILAYHEDMIR